jgi:hypothetical protein
MSNCDCWDYDPPSVYRDETRRAKKPYKCCDCGAAINPGDEHHYIFGVWDGFAQSFRMCALCMDMRRQCEFACEPLSQLADAVYECENQEAGEVVAFKKRYEANR